MRITNPFNVEPAWVRAVEEFESDYDAVGDYSITSLSNPIRLTLLKKRHPDKISQDVCRSLWSLLGHAMHEILRRMADENTMTEQRFVMEIADRIISFKPDMIKKIGPNSYCGVDFKVPKVSCTRYKPRTDWINQANWYTFGLKEVAGITVTKWENQLLLKDWNDREAQNKSNYPQVPLVKMPIPLLPHEEAGAQLEKRIEEYKAHENTPDDDLPFCTAEERWAQPSKWAVVYRNGKRNKDGSRRAKKNFDSRAEAENYANAEYDIEFRKAESIRCERGWCPCTVLCNQFKQEIMNIPF